MFENILGQERVKKILSRQIANQKLPHAYLFIGQDRIGKKTVAFELAKILNCSINDWTETDAGACGHCPSCVKISKNGHPDIHFIDLQKQLDINVRASEKTREILIDTIRKGVIDIIASKIREAKWRFFIIDRADAMNEDAANALLKTLEEPSERNIIILTARHKESLPQTILSRCGILFFAPLKKDEIVSFLIKNNSLSAESADAAARTSDGSIPNLSNIADDKRKEIEEVLNLLLGKKLEAYRILELYKSKNRDESVDFIDTAVNKIKADFRIRPFEFLPILEILGKYRELILKNVNCQNAFENMFFEINEAANKNLKS
jgi:DNA polymerase-3 subunit delta'